MWRAVNTSRLEQALRNAEFEPDQERIWRWKADGVDARTIVKFELLANLDDAPAGANVAFDGCDQPGSSLSARRLTSMLSNLYRAETSSSKDERDSEREVGAYMTRNW